MLPWCCGRTVPKAMVKSELKGQLATNAEPLVRRAVMLRPSREFLRVQGCALHGHSAGQATG